MKLTSRYSRNSRKTKLYFPSKWTADEIEVSTLSAIAADIGAVTAGTLSSSDWAATAGIRMDLGNKWLKMGGSNVDAAGAAAGIFLGLDTSYKSYIGDGSGHYIKFDGANLIIGPDTLIGAGTLDAGNVLGWAHASDVTKMDGADLYANSVVAAAIAAGTITAAELAANSVTADEIASGVIVSDHISANTIVAGDIAANAITASELAANAVEAAHISAGAVEADAISAGVITATHLAANSVDTSELVAGAVTANEIAANTILAGNIAAGAVDTSELNAGAVTAVKIATGTITATQLAANSVDSSEITAGAIDAGHISAGAIDLGGAAVTGDLDDVPDGTTYGRVLETSLTAGGAVLTSSLSGTVSASTIISAGSITVTEMNASASDRLMSSSTIRSNIEAWRHGSDTTKIDGGDIYASTITASQIGANEIIANSANIKDLIVDTAHIASLAIETAKIDNNAATIPSSAYTSAGTSPTINVDTAIAGVTYTSAGEVVHIQASCICTTFGADVNLAVVSIKRDNSTILASYNITGTGNFAIVANDDTGSGSTSYHLYVYPQGSGADLTTTFGSRSILTIEAKK